MINKRGDLLKTTLEIVVAVICIGVFFLGAYRLYQANASQEEQQVTSTLEAFVSRLDAVPENQRVGLTFQGFEGASSWFLVGYDHGDEFRPQKCFFSSCICFCPVNTEVSESSYAEELSVSCQSNKGICREVSQSTLNVQPRIVVNTVSRTDRRTAETNEYEIRTVIGLPENLYELYVVKNKTYLEVSW